MSGPAFGSYSQLSCLAADEVPVLNALHAIVDRVAHRRVRIGMRGRCALHISDATLAGMAPSRYPLCLPPICWHVVVIAHISSAVNWTVSMASVGDATPPPHIILMKSAPPLSSSRVAFRTCGTPSAVRPRDWECPAQQPELLVEGPKSAWPPVWGL